MKITGIEWDEDIIAVLLYERDIALIFGIPLSLFASKDHWCWISENLGIYSVESGYYLLPHLKGGQLDSSWFWRRLWNLKIPPKVKKIIWHAMSHCILVQTLLKWRHAQNPVECPICNGPSETVVHAFVQYSFVTQCLNRL